MLILLLKILCYCFTIDVSKWIVQNYNKFQLQHSCFSALRLFICFCYEFVFAHLYFFLHSFCDYCGFGF